MTKVTITEFLDIAKAFYPDGKEAKFVNGVLDHMARTAKPQAFSRLSGETGRGDKTRTISRPPPLVPD